MMICEYCDEPCEARRSTKRFCTDRCRLAARSGRKRLSVLICKECGQEFPNPGIRGRPPLYCQKYVIDSRGERRTCRKAVKARRRPLRGSVSS